MCTAYVQGAAEPENSQAILWGHFPKFLHQKTETPITCSVAHSCHHTLIHGPATQEREENATCGVGLPFLGPQVCSMGRMTTHLEDVDPVDACFWLVALPASHWLRDRA